MDEETRERRQRSLIQREQKRIQAALRLRDVPPERSVRQMFQLMRFTKNVSEAADHAQRS